MDGTVKYVNLRTGPDGNLLPTGNDVGDVLRWNGSAWLPAQLSGVVVRKFRDASSEYVPPIKVPAGKFLQSIVLQATYGDEAVQLSAGTQEGKDDVFQSFAISGIDSTYNPEGLTTIAINRLFSLTNDTDIILQTIADSDDWKGITLDVYLIMISLI